MIVKSLRTLYVEQLKDLHKAERQLFQALPRMARAAASEELRNAFTGHLGRTRKHVYRIEAILDRTGERVQGRRYGAADEKVKGATVVAFVPRAENYEIANMVAQELRNAFAGHLARTGQYARRIESIFEHLGEKAQGGVKDAALIAAAQRAAHYAIAGYGCVRTYAAILEEKDAAVLLAQTLDEKKETGEALNVIAAHLNVEAEPENRKAEDHAVLPPARPGGTPVLSPLQV